MRGLWDTDPIISFSILPLSLSFCLIFYAEPYSVSMHLVVFKLTYVFVAICKNLCSLSFHFSLFKLTFIFVAIRPWHYSFAFHIIINEVSLIHFSSVSEIVFSNSLKLTINKISIIITTIKLKSPFSCLLTLRKFTFILYSVIIPTFCSISVLLIVYPVSSIHASIWVNKYAIAVCFSILPLPLINISVNMCHSSITII